MNEKKRPYRISSDPYAGEVMNVQREDDGTFYVEIPELEWSQDGLATPEEAAEKGLAMILAYGNASNNTEKRKLVRERLEKIQDITKQLQHGLELVSAAEINYAAELYFENIVCDNLSQIEDALKILFDRLAEGEDTCQEIIVQIKEEINLRENTPNAKISPELYSLLDDAPRVRYAMQFFAPDSPFPVKAVGFRLWKDVDGDGDLDYAFILWSDHKKLVEGKYE